MRETSAGTTERESATMVIRAGGCTCRDADQTTQRNITTHQDHDHRTGHNTPNHKAQLDTKKPDQDQEANREPQEDPTAEQTTQDHPQEDLTTDQPTPDHRHEDHTADQPDPDHPRGNTREETRPRAPETDANTTEITMTAEGPTTIGAKTSAEVGTTTPSTA